jgi:response regulator RpfG family c-di-GMP phosphodiesterase
MLDNPFTIFKHTVNVLVVDDMPEFWMSVKGVLDLFGIYSVRIAETTREALEIISQSPKRFHACLFDLGINDVERNEFYLLDKFGDTIPFTIMSATADTEKSFECKNRGAKTFVKKATPGFSNKLVSSLDKYALINMICPGYEKDEESILSKCVDALEKSNQLHVSEWANEVDVLEGKLRKECKGQMTVKPKQALCVYHIFREIFKHVEKSCADNEPESWFSQEECGKRLLNSTTYIRFFEYYILNKQKIDTRIFGILPHPVTP